MKRYDSLDGVRMLACFGIVIMHILANGKYIINPILNDIIMKFTDFVVLFMILSAFSVCCGYYEKIKNNKITMEEFYKKRISKILPFFIMLILIDIVVEHNKISIIEGFADATMLFGFLPKSLSVIGVAWFLGVVFIFYLMFPFFTYLFSNKKRAWIVTVISLIMNYLSFTYFEIDRANMFHSFSFFCIGGLIFLYKDNLIKLCNKNRIMSFCGVILSSILYFLPLDNYILYLFQILLFSCVLIIYAISFNKSLLNNKITHFFGGNISLEIYLSHMLIFRIIEKLKLLYLTENNYISYIITIVIVISGTVLFSKIYKNFINYIATKKSNNNLHNT